MQFSRRLPKILAIVLATSLSFTSVFALAEDGTSGLPPDAILSCQIVPAEWSAASAATPAATPAGSPQATPVNMATPVSEEVTVDPLTADLIDAAGSILDCMSENNLDVLTKVTGPEFRGTWLGFGGNINDEDLAILLPQMPRLPYALSSVENASVEGDTATATVNYTVGRQLLSSEWTFSLTDVDGKDVWTVQSESLMVAEAPEGAVRVDLTVNDESFTFSSATLNKPDAVINVANSGERPHEVLILRVPEGVGVAEIAKAPTGIPEGGTFVAQATVSAGNSGTMILTDLRPGTYTVVDLLPDGSGIPNVSNGMITTFEVTEP